MGIREMGRAKGVYGTGVKDSVWSQILGIPEECGLAFLQTRDSLEGQCPCASADWLHLSILSEAGVC